MLIIKLFLNLDITGFNVVTKCCDQNMVDNTHLQTDKYFYAVDTYSWYIRNTGNSDIILCDLENGVTDNESLVTPCLIIIIVNISFIYSILAKKNEIFY